MKRRFPLGPTLTAAFVLAALLPALLVAWLLSSNSAQSINTLAENAMSQAAHRVDVGALAHLGESHTVVNALVPPFKPSGAEAERTRKWLQDSRAFEDMAYALTQQSPNVPYLYAGTADGSFFGLEREDRGFVVRQITPADAGRRHYLIAQPGDRSQLEKVETSRYDPRLRPWYKLAAETGQRVFTNVYRSAVKPQFDLTLAQPIHDDDGKTLLGVIAVDMSLARLTDLIRSTRISNNAVTYLIDSQGLFVASSVDEPLSRVYNGQHRRISPQLSSDPLVRASYEQLRQRDANAVGTPGLVRLAGPSNWRQMFGLGESRLMALQRPFGDKYGLDWQLIVVAPETDFTWQVIRARQWALAGMAGLIVLCAVAALLVARGLSRQFSLLNASASALGAGEVPPVQDAAPLQEVHHLSQVMHRSALQLQAFNHEIRQKNEQLHEAAQGLEARVRERTAELAASREEALAAVQAKAGFLAVMSHEIRTPLNGVVGMSEVLAETPLSDNQRELFGVLRLSCVQLQSVVGDILDFSRIEAGRLELEQHPFDLRSAIEQSVQMVQLPALEKGLALRVDIAPDVPLAVIGDVTRLRQVLLNLLSNAIKFTHTGQVVLRVWFTAAGQSLHFSITDTGVGIRADKLDQLFQPFAQGDSSTTRVYGGTGLGLAICRHLVTLMGGRIEVRSQHGQGSCFEFSIQVAMSDPTRLETPVAGEPAPRAVGLRVLVVDDNAVNLRVAAAMLQRLGHAHETASGGRVALARMEAALGIGQPFTHVLLDRHMPDLDGVATAQAILHRLGEHAPRLIGVSASSLGEDRQRCLDAGMSDYLPKPLLLADLAQALKQQVPSPLLATAPHVAQAPWVDAARWTGFAEFDDAQGSLRRDIVNEFLDAFAARLSAVQDAARAGHADVLHQRAHFLKGAAANVGAARLAQACESLEAATQAGELDTDAVNRVLACEAGTREALTQLIQPAASTDQTI